MKAGRLLLAVILLALVATGIWLGMNPRKPSSAVPAASSPTPSPTPALAPSAPEAPPLETKLLEELLETFVTTTHDDAERARAMLENIRREIRSLPPEHASQIIQNFLASGKDATTGLQFVPGENDTLIEAPTLRIFLLDLLEKIDPEAAARLANAILNAPANADEWAIALRTRQNTQPATLPQNLTSLQRALQNPEWIAKPSQGLLHALDLAAMAGDFSTVMRLAELAEPPENETWAEGLAVTMHRMARESPAATLRELNANPDFLAEQPLARADLIAYANLANPEERRLVEERLANPQISLDEKQKILHMLVAPGEFVHEGLFTEAPGMVMAQDEEARFSVLIATMTDWLELFPELRPSIREVAEYLTLE